MKVESLLDMAEDEQTVKECQNKIYEYLLLLNIKDYNRLYNEIEGIIWAQNGHIFPEWAQNGHKKIEK